MVMIKKKSSTRLLISTDRIETNIMYMYERKSFFLFLLFVQRGSFPSVHSLFPSYFSSISHTRTSYSPMVLSPIALSSVLYPVQPAMPLDGGGRAPSFSTCG